MDKLRSIATLKFIGAPDRVIIAMIVQQALALGLGGFVIGLALIEQVKGYFPHHTPDARVPVRALRRHVCGRTGPSPSAALRC